VKLYKPSSTAPFSFGFVQATYALALQLKETGALAYDPERDIVMVAAAIAAMGSASGPSLQEKTGLPLRGLTMPWRTPENNCLNTLSTKRES